jgi:benzoyl-CoA reductase subunit B
MINYQTYETKPLECWQKMKELRRAHVRHLWHSKEQGVPLIIGTAEIFQALPAGLGDYAGFGFGPNFGRIIRDPDLTNQCLEALEARGYGRDICGVCRVNLGSMLLGLQTLDRSGNRIQPDFCYQIHACDPLGKASQFISEYYKIPYFVLDIPPIANETTKKYFLSQMLDAIEWMERVSGRKYEDEKLIEAVYNETESMVLWARVCQLNQAIPAPIDLRHLASLVMPLWTAKHKRETVEYLQLLLAEVEDRVRNHISARGFERLRLIHWGQWPWYFPKLLRYPEKYGALFIGSNASFGVYAAFTLAEDGTWVVSKGLKEQGIELKTREEALNVLIDFYVHNPTMQSLFPFSPNAESQVKLMEQWHGQAAVFNLCYDCKGMTSGQLEARLALQTKGIPTVLYEVSSCDPRDFDEVQVTDRLESFLESLGLIKYQPGQ